MAYIDITAETKTITEINSKEYGTKHIAKLLENAIEKDILAM